MRKEVSAKNNVGVKAEGRTSIYLSGKSVERYLVLEIQRVN
ncbi:hypothetical protein [Desulfosporosinus nitroreducens]|nr:hypothetical protein [Desulfosporosinus nitroreducens]